MHHHKFENSSAINSCSYNPDEKILTINFHSSTHHFENVPATLFDEMKSCESAGKFYHAKIRGKYNERK